MSSSILMCSIFLTFHSSFDTNGLLFVHGVENGNQALFLFLEFGHDFLSKIIIDVKKLIVLALHIRHIHVVGGGADIFVLLASKDINTNQVHLCVTMLASF